MMEESELLVVTGKGRARPVNTEGDWVVATAKSQTGRAKHYRKRCKEEVFDTQEPTANFQSTQGSSTKKQDKRQGIQLMGPLVFKEKKVETPEKNIEVIFKSFGNERKKMLVN